jgi:6-phosphogluconolactonase
VTVWDVYVGTLTKEFASEIANLRKGSNDPWRGNAKKVGMDDRGYPQGGRFAEGVEHFAFDDADGSIRYVDGVTDLVCPQYVTLHPTLPVLYTAEWARPSRLSAFTILPDGSLKKGSSTPSLGELAVAVAVHPSGKTAYVAHWGDGALSAVPLDDEGMVGPAAAIVAGDPEGITGRAHHHQVVVTPNGRTVLVTDVGADELLAYASDGDGNVSPEPVARLAFPAGSGPRHLELHPSGNFLYVLGEWDSLLHVVAATDGIPTAIVGSVPTTPPGHEGKDKTSEIHLHPDGRTLYVGNRSSNSITAFSVDASGGEVRPIDHEPSLGHGPAAVRVDPSGRYVVVGNVYSGSFAVFGIDSDGGLESLGAPVEARSPRSFVFRPRST